jgi:transposase-like protein
LPFCPKVPGVRLRLNVVGDFLQQLTAAADDFHSIPHAEKQPMATTDDLSRFCCQNPDCSDYGQRNTGRLTVCGHYGKQARRLLYCKTCKYRFSERKGTPFFQSRLPDEQVVSLLHHIAEGCGVRKTGRLIGVDKDTVVRYSLRAGQQARQLHDDLVAFSPRDTRGPIR